MPERSYIHKEDETMLGFKAFKDRVTLLEGNVAEFKLKPLLNYRSQNPRALKRISKHTLPVYYHANNKAWMTQLYLMTGSPTVSYPQSRVRPCTHDQTCPMKTVRGPFSSDMSAGRFWSDVCTHHQTKIPADRERGDVYRRSLTRKVNASTHVSNQFDACAGFRASGHVRWTGFQRTSFLAC